MRALAALLKKECLLLLRDWHALLLLFVMPAAFILIMSLALQDRFEAHGKVSASYYLVAEDASPLAQSIAGKLAANALFKHSRSFVPCIDCCSRTFIPTTAGLFASAAPAVSAGFTQSRFLILSLVPKTVPMAPMSTSAKILVDAVLTMYFTNPRIIG